MWTSATGPTAERTVLYTLQLGCAVTHFGGWRSNTLAIATDDPSSAGSSVELVCTPAFSATGFSGKWKLEGRQLVGPRQFDYEYLVDLKVGADGQLQGEGLLNDGCTRYLSRGRLCGTPPTPSPTSPPSTVGATTIWVEYHSFVQGGPPCLCQAAVTDVNAMVGTWRTVDLESLSCPVLFQVSERFPLIPLQNCLFTIHPIQGYGK